VIGHLDSVCGLGGCMGEGTHLFTDESIHDSIHIAENETRKRGIPGTQMQSWCFPTSIVDTFDLISLCPL
jgi:hypothetical protein